MKDKEVYSAISAAERLEELRQNHIEIDGRIQALELQGGADLEVMSLKRQKLQIKEEIERISNNALPDIIA